MIIKKETMQTGSKAVAIPIKNVITIITIDPSIHHDHFSFINDPKGFPLAAKTIMIAPRTKRIISPVFIISLPSYIKKTLHLFYANKLLVM